MNLRRQPQVLLLWMMLVFMARPAAGADEPFDAVNPGLFRPGKTYALQITPKPGLEPVTIRFYAQAEAYGLKDGNGEPYVGISRITWAAPGGEEKELKFELVDTSSDTDFSDYDRDGDLDFRVLSWKGSGGRGYCYYRWVDGGYESWAEPEKLDLSSGPHEDGTLSSYWREPPEMSISYYLFRDGKFRLARTQSELTTKSVPELRDRPDVHEFEMWKVVEEFDADERLARRIVEVLKD
jgi:hypothetical protein